MKLRRAVRRRAHHQSEEPSMRAQSSMAAGTWPALAGAIACIAGCASGGAPRPQDDPAIVAAVRADARVLGGETTWVARGRGYQLVGMTRADIAAFDSGLAHLSGAYAGVFGAAPPELIAVVSHVTSTRNSIVRTLPPLPAGTSELVVELNVTDRSPTDRTRNEREAERGIGFGGMYGGGYGRGYGCSSGDFGAGDYRRRLCDGEFGGPGGSGRPGESSTDAIMRAWLSARATKITGLAAGPGTDGRSFDPRVPAWAESMLPRLAAADSVRDRLTLQLAAQPESLYAFRDFFTMLRPNGGAFADRLDTADAGGNRGSGGGRGFGGGGGTGGMRGAKGREGGRSGRNRSVLGGSALFDAQALVVGRYLVARQGAPLIGQLVDAQLRGKPVADVLAAQAAGPKDIESLDADWREWLRQYAATPGG
jgi:hypothetical protein